MEWIIEFRLVFGLSEMEWLFGCLTIWQDEQVELWMDGTERKGKEWNGCIIPYMRIVIRLWALRERRFCSLTSSRVEGLLGWDLSWSLDTGRDGIW